MAKEVQAIQFNVRGTKNPDGSWGVTASATLAIGIEEYPGWITSKGIPIELTPTQEDTIKKFVTTVVLPQAEAAK